MSPVETGDKFCAFHAVTEHRSAEIKLFSTKKLVKSANQSKSRFLANISHEICTPLGAMLGFAGLLKKEGLALKDKSQFLETITRNGYNLTLLIDDILDLSKVRSK